MRNGAPLPGRTPDQVMSLLVHRALGPLRPDLIRAVLDYHGLAGSPAASPQDTARRCDITVGMLTVHTAKVRVVGAALPLRAVVVTATIRDSEPGDDHLGRVRIARTLGLPAPRKPPAPRPGAAAPTAALRTARAAARVLAAAGPLNLAALHEAITRYQRYRHRTPVNEDDLALALSILGATQDEQGTWRPPPGTPVPDRYRAVITGGAGRDLTRQDVITVLTAAGYATSSAAALVTAHPLIHRTGPNRYRTIGNGPTQF